MGYCVESDLYLAAAENTVIEYVDDEGVVADRKPTLITQFQVDTGANQTGHFEDEDGTTLTVGPGQSAEHIAVGDLIQIARNWYTITAISGDGGGADLVTVSGTPSLGEATFEVTALKPTAATARINRGIDDACAEIDQILEERGFTVPITAAVESQSMVDRLRAITVDIALYHLYSRHTSVMQREETHIRRVRYKAALAALEKLEPNSDTTLGMEVRTYDAEYDGNLDAGPRHWTRESAKGGL